MTMEQVVPDQLFYAAVMFLFLVLIIALFAPKDV